MSLIIPTSYTYLDPNPYLNVRKIQNELNSQMY